MSLQQALFSPRSVAVVGQSDDAGKTAGRPLKFLRQLGYAGRVYPINPRRETVLGERAWPSLAALPEPPDHVYVVTPTTAAVEAVEECGRLGVKVVTVLADGFAEAGAAGLARETRLRDVCTRTGLRIVGPSSLGIVDLRSKAMLTANAAFDETELPVGRMLSAEIAHKTDVGGVVLGVADAAGLLAAIRKIRTDVAERQPGARVGRVLVQPMVTGVGEVLVGYRVDRDVGPLVMVASGGVRTEIERDRSLRLAPVDAATAREMLAELRGLPLLSGYRGRPTGDLAALAQAIVALSQLADEPTVVEAEINPLIVRPAGEGVTAVDALATLTGNT